MLDGRVKTLHPAVHGGLLARRDLPEHMSAIAAHGIEPIDLVCVNLYPFRETVADRGRHAGGRDRADRHRRAVDAPLGREELRVGDGGGRSGRLRARARGAARAAPTRWSCGASSPRKVFAHTAAYDAEIAAWFARAARATMFPRAPRRSRSSGSSRCATARTRTSSPRSTSRSRARDSRRSTQHGGKELSFNNLLDLEGALLATGQFAGETCCAIVKHTTPCGLATGATAAEAYRKALACDPMSAFGSVIAFTVPVDEDAARAVAAPVRRVRRGARRSAPRRCACSARRRTCACSRATARAGAGALDFKRVRGGLLVQERAGAPLDETRLDRSSPSGSRRRRSVRDLLFAWRTVASVKSNAIVLTRDGATIGIGAGQMSRVDAAFVAVHKAQAAGPRHQGRGAGLGRVLPVPRRRGSGGRGGGTSDRPAGGLGEGPGGHRGGERARDRDDLHGDAGPSGTSGREDGMRGREPQRRIPCPASCLPAFRIPHTAFRHLPFPAFRPAVRAATL